MDLTKPIARVNLGKRKFRRIMKVKCRFCAYDCDRMDNLKRHENETHCKILKTCECGKKFTSSALSRHKKICQQKKSDKVRVDLSAYDIPNDQIAAVHERIFKVKLVTLKNGTVIALHNDIKVDGYTFTLKLAEPDGE